MVDEATPNRDTKSRERVPEGNFGRSLKPMTAKCRSPRRAQVAARGEAGSPQARRHVAHNRDSPYRQREVRNFLLYGGRSRVGAKCRSPQNDDMVVRGEAMLPRGGGSPHGVAIAPTVLLSIFSVRRAFKSRREMPKPAKRRYGRAGWGSAPAWRRFAARQREACNRRWVIVGEILTTTTAQMFPAPARRQGRLLQTGIRVHPFSALLCGAFPLSSARRRV